MIPGFVAIILQYSSSGIISGFSSASTTFTIALVPFILIPTHAKSSLSNRNLLIISFVSISFFQTPIFNPSCSIVCNKSSVGIVSFPCISIFQTKLDNTIIPTTISIKKRKKIFLLLYL